jgi:hypothetical protein
MSLESIGVASRDIPSEHIPDGLSFSVPYDSKPFHITLENQDLNRLLQRGLSKILEGDSVEGFDFEIRLPKAIPLYVGAVALNIVGERNELHDVYMDVGVCSMSILYEHRGILQIDRPGWSENWRYIGYETLPPLTDPSDTRY